MMPHSITQKECFERFWEDYCKDCIDCPFHKNCRIWNKEKGGT